MSIKYILIITIIIIKSVSSFGQLYLISPYDSYSKDEIINNLKGKNKYHESNFGLFYKGTNKRLEYTTKDTLFNDSQLKRITFFDFNGAVIFDSLIIDDSLTITRVMLKKDSLNILQLFKNQKLSKSDTFIFDNKHNLIEHLAESSKTFFQYDSINRLIKQINITPSNQVATQVFYYNDSILVSETKTNKYSHEFTKWYYFFNENNFVVKDSFFVLKHQYRPPNFDTFYRTDTSFSSTIYLYDKLKNHIETSFGVSKHVWKYEGKRIIQDFSLSDGKLLGKTEYSYPEENIVIKRDYDEDSRAIEMKMITYQNGKIVKYISINNIFQFEQRKTINLDTKGRIISSYKLTSGDENNNDCKRIEYIDY